MDTILALYPNLTTCGLNETRTKTDEFTLARIEFLRTLIRVSIVPDRCYKVGSYGGKHSMEHLVKFYFTNGEFILAMLMEGYPMRENGINCVFKARYRVPNVGANNGHILDWTPTKYPLRRRGERNVEEARLTLQNDVKNILDTMVPTWREGDIFSKLAAVVGNW